MEEELTKDLVNKSGVSVDGLIISFDEDEKIWEVVTEMELQTKQLWKNSENHYTQPVDR